MLPCLFKGAWLFFLKKASDHAPRALPMNEVPKELLEKARAAIYKEDERARSLPKWLESLIKS